MRELDQHSVPHKVLFPQASLTPPLEGSLGREAGASCMGAKALPPLSGPFSLEISQGDSDHPAGPPGAGTRHLLGPGTF